MSAENVGETKHVRGKSMILKADFVETEEINPKLVMKLHLHLHCICRVTPSIFRLKSGDGMGCKRISAITDFSRIFRLNKQCGKKAKERFRSGVD